ncbi:MAG: DNA-directed RNA polymerase [Thermoplasmatota archaeon]
MYKMEKKQDTIRIPPHRLNEDIDEVAKDIARNELEGIIEDENKLIILATNIKRQDGGKVVHGDGGIYQDVKYDALLFELVEQELILGYLCEVLKFGAFVRFGPLDGLLHISQIMNDKVEVDQGNQRLVGKEQNKSLTIDDEIRARIVTVSVNERSPRESKIGLTMRQNGLGKIEWIEEELEEEEAS